MAMGLPLVTGVPVETRKLERVFGVEAASRGWVAEHKRYKEQEGEYCERRV